jgi:DNA-binding response OmpR family regulator
LFGNCSGKLRPTEAASGSEYDASVSEARGLVMVVEDEPHIAELERDYLRAAGYGVHVESDGRAALDAVGRLSPVLIVLDVGVPGIDGVELCRRLRARDDWTPVVFVTARDDEVDRVLGLEVGGDDYVTKPFSPRELVARVGSVLRRHHGPSTPSTLSLGGVRLDRDSRRVEADGRPVELTPTEFGLLAELIGHPGRVFTRPQLLASVWGQADYGQHRTVDVHVAQLRAKLGPACPIRTVHGIGYRADGAHEH